MTNSNMPRICEVNGKTRVVVILAYPATHVRTPTFFNALAAARDLNAVLVPWQVAPEQLASVMDSLRHVENLAGVIVTIPHKQSIAGLCDELEGIAASLQVANVARRMADGRFIGRMYDGAGFAAGMKREGIELAGCSVLLLGAGGAGTAVADALLDAGVGRLAILNRNRERAEELVRRLRDIHPQSKMEAVDDPRGNWDIVVNSTSLGLHAEDPLPIDPDCLPRGCTVAEVIMQPDETALLRAARERGCRIHKGVHMVTAQIELLAEFLLGSEAKTEGISH
ncbi:shikimate dehydrogenase family protein [Noviherbaspirillum denitrificans]|uniref:shikimate dehydrogenase (NADP(+)) n=1 Tax=Noviherbaspirillum denitrificans TaxID=1968433 RepID=A0A254TIF6_9BURK|nr:shikimate dehydrogenase [Noviherbaspirillum denitrificans]OWW22409.1 shikimate dehydrogenase [Noviherbaspirillum denitrificans]